METLTLEMKEITTSLILNPKNSANVPFLLLQESNNARLRPNLQFDPSLVNTFGDSNRSSKMYVTTSGTSTLSRALAYGMRNKHYYTKDFPLHIILGKGSHYLTNTEDTINRARVGCSVVITGASRETTWIHGSLWIEGGPQDHVSLRSDFQVTKGHSNFHHHVVQGIREDYALFVKHDYPKPKLSKAKI